MPLPLGVSYLEIKDNPIRDVTNNVERGAVRTSSLCQSQASYAIVFLISFDYCNYFYGMNLVIYGWTLRY
jgi:hypothetical protein